MEVDWNGVLTMEVGWNGVLTMEVEEDDVGYSSL